MRVRKVAKQLKLFHKNVEFDEDGLPITHYKVSCYDSKMAYIIRMTRKHYFGLAKRYPPDSLMGKFYIHKACSYSYDIFCDIMSFWGLDLDE